MKEQELRDKFKRFVNGYVGSSMLTNTEYPETIEANAEKCVQIAKDYAEQESIEFGVWLSVNCKEDNSRDGWYYYKDEILTVSELYQLFKNRENER